MRSWKSMVISFVLQLQSFYTCQVYRRLGYIVVLDLQLSLYIYIYHTIYYIIICHKPANLLQ